MDLQALTRDIDRLSAADAVVADSYVRHILSKSGLCALAGLIAVIGLTWLSVSFFWLLAQTLSQAAAAAIVGVLYAALAAAAFVLAALLKPGREYAFALDVRRSALQQMERDVAAHGRLDMPLYPSGEAMISAIVVPLVATLLRTLSTSRTENAATTVSDK